MIAKAIRILRARGPAGLAYAIRTRLRGLMARRAASFDACTPLFAGKRGIEIGGPSSTFSSRGLFPVYPLLAGLDNCTYGDRTVWQGAIVEGQTYRFDRTKPPGTQYIAEATDLHQFEDDAFDFVLASHVLEHVANPIRALVEWKRIVREGGLIAFILPDRTHTFDHQRSVTTLDHLVADFQHNTGEDDLTHLPEILARHDLRRDPEAGDADAFRQRSMDNLRHRCLHHHVFDPALVKSLLTHTGLVAVEIDVIPPYHILAIARKVVQPMRSAMAS